MNATKITVTLSATVIALVCVAMFAIPQYSVWQQGLSGKAKLKEAEYSKQVAIEEAKAALESAGLKAQAEVERAKGVAEANKIIGDSLRDNESYLRYLWIQGLQDGSSEVIYIPTEANLPILEAARKGTIPANPTTPNSPKSN